MCTVAETFLDTPILVLLHPLTASSCRWCWLTPGPKSYCYLNTEHNVIATLSTEASPQYKDLEAVITIIVALTEASSESYGCMNDILIETSVILHLYQLVLVRHGSQCALTLRSSARLHEQ